MNALAPMMTRVHSEKEISASPHYSLSPKISKQHGKLGCMSTAVLYIKDLRFFILFSRLRVHVGALPSLILAGGLSRLYPSLLTLCNRLIIALPYKVVVPDLMYQMWSNLHYRATEMMLLFIALFVYLPYSNNGVGNQNQQDDKWLHKSGDRLLTFLKPGQNLPREKMQTPGLDQAGVRENHQPTPCSGIAIMSFWAGDLDQISSCTLPPSSLWDCICFLILLDIWNLETAEPRLRLACVQDEACKLIPWNPRASAQRAPVCLSVCVLQHMGVV